MCLLDRRILCVCLLVLLPSGALAWGREGHLIVCALAEEQLTSEGRKFVEYVTSLGEFLDGETPSFPDGCLWPDSARYRQFRGTYESHFINVPASAVSIELSRDCAALDCIVAGIQRSLVYLSNPDDGDREKGRKAAALRFLAHYIADLHQPLHVSHGEDWGGNRIKVTWFGQESNLHRVWDYGIVERAGIAWPDSRAMLKSIRVRRQPVDILAWMNETLSLARSKAYTGPSGRKITSGDALGQPYFEHAKPVVIEQLATGAARLAMLINGLARGDVDPVFLRLER